MIEMKGVSVAYPNGSLGLEAINCKIEKGEFVFLVGPTGHGKTTLLRLIYRNILPTGGSVRVGGLSLDRLSPRQVALLRRRMGIVFQDFRLLPHRTVWENIAFAMRVTGTSRRRIHRQVPALLALVGLAHKAESFPGQISAGEQQRVAIARALANAPSLLLADEPTGNLDPDSGWGIMSLLTELNKSGTTVVCATHNQAIVDALRRRVITLTQGKIISDVPQGSYRVPAVETGQG
jgi:cell division transport system ATP-binding protein